MKIVRLLVVLSLLTAATTPSIATANEPSNIASANEPPLADAGLDQTVTRGMTVYLDAGESRDPDGSLVSYEWTVTRESENKTTVTPVCSDCEQTRFQPEATGTYRVTLEVTDDDQTSSTDSLFVEVRAGEAPSVTLAGDSRTTTGDATRFTADVTGGAAPLRQLVWNVDGERVTTDSLSGSANTTGYTARFPTTGTHTVSVVAIDENDQRDTATRETTVVDSKPPSAEPTDGSGTANPVPDVTGPRVVTGHGTLGANYELTDAASGTWMLNGRRTGSGATTSVSLSPGIHELYAATDDGVATFPDGNRNVVADPAPELTVGNLTDTSVVPVDIYATDDFGNLQSVTISVDGDPVETHSIEQTGGERIGRQLSTVEVLDSLESGSHAITVRARDARGQTDVVVRTVTVPGPPEVVSAGFIRDGPLDQYHPRIDESRYTATYRVKVKLNGVDPSSVRSWIEMKKIHSASSVNRTYRPDNDLLIIEKYTYRSELGEIIGKGELRWRGSNPVELSWDSIKLTSSSPEIRLTSFDNQRRYISGKGMGLDASDSFDPDGTQLVYTWHNAQNEDVKQPRVYLETFDYTYLEARDKTGQSTNSTDLLSWLAPKIDRVTYEGSEPFYPNETITFTVWSERYLITKPTYDNLTAYSLRPDEGRVTNSTLLKDAPREEDMDNTLYFPRWHRWTVEVPASAFLDGGPNVTSYSTEHPVVQHGFRLPEPEVYASTTHSVEDVSIDLQYRVERPDTATRQTANKDVKDSLVAEGYSVEKITESGHEYELEEYAKVREPTYDVDQMSFDRKGRRSHFLSVSPEWERAGTNLETELWTTTEDVWRFSRNGEGTYTGETRRKLVEEGVYRTEKQYEYEATETYQTTVRYQDTYTTTETEISYEEKCSYYGCFRYRTTDTKTIHHTVTRTKTVTRTRTVDRTYWSRNPRSLSHDYTGKIRRVTISEPEYERQYQFEVKRQHSETNRVYLAEQRTLVEPAKYSWVTMMSVSNRLQAETVAKDSDIRIGEVVPATEWTLTKPTGTEMAYVYSPEPEWEVLETIGDGEVTLVQRYVEKDGKRLPVKQTREKSIDVEHSELGLVSKEKIRNIIVKNVEDNPNA